VAELRPENDFGIITYCDRSSFKLQRGDRTICPVWIKSDHFAPWIRMDRAICVAPKSSPAGGLQRGRGWGG